MENEIVEIEKPCLVKEAAKAFTINASASAGAIVGVLGAIYLVERFFGRRNAEDQVAEESN